MLLSRYLIGIVARAGVIVVIVEVVGCVVDVAVDDGVVVLAFQGRGRRFFCKRLFLALNK